jgi:hypothetical protein
LIFDHFIIPQEKGNCFTLLHRAVELAKILTANIMNDERVKVLNARENAAFGIRVA